jgi:hypothetical protein
MATRQIGSSLGSATMPNAAANASTLARNIDTAEQTFDPKYLDTMGRATFPASYLISNQQESRYLDAAKTVVHQSGAKIVYNLGEKEVGLMLKTEDALRKYQYDRAFMQIVRQYSQDPASLDKFRNLYPEFFKLRLQYVSQVAKVQARIATMKLMGVQTREDLDFMLSLNVMDAAAKSRMFTMLNLPIHQLDEAGVNVDQPVFIAGRNNVPRYNDKQLKLKFEAGGMLRFTAKVANEYDPMYIGASTLDVAEGIRGHGFRDSDVTSDFEFANMLPYTRGDAVPGRSIQMALNQNEHL